MTLFYATSFSFSYDFVKIYNGGIADSNLIPDGELTGTKTETTITVLGTTVTILLLSDSSEARAGFQIEFTAGKGVVYICQLIARYHRDTYRYLFTSNILICSPK